MGSQFQERSQSKPSQVSPSSPALITTAVRTFVLVLRIGRRLRITSSLIHTHHPSLIPSYTIIYHPITPTIYLSSVSSNELRILQKWLESLHHHHHPNHHHPYQLASITRITCAFISLFGFFFRRADRFDDDFFASHVNEQPQQLCFADLPLLYG